MKQQQRRARAVSKKSQKILKQQKSQKTQKSQKYNCSQKRQKSKLYGVSKLMRASNEKPLQGKYKHERVAEAQAEALAEVKEDLKQLSQRGMFNKQEKTIDNYFKTKAQESKAARNARYQKQKKSVIKSRMKWWK